MTFAIPELTTLFMLAFARVGILVMLMPGLGERFVMPRLRLAIALFLTLMMMPILRPLLPAGLAPAAIVGLLIGEIAVGLVLGLATRAVMAALQTAGNVVASQIGLSFAMSVDPAAGGQEAVIGNFLSLLGATLIFATDLHHLAIGAIRESYSLLPPAGIPDSGDVARLAIGAVARGFALGVKIAAPFVVFALLFNLGLGILSRLMPQLQVFFLALPLSVLIGMLILLACLGMMMSVYLADLGRFLQGLGSV
ncbi:flagellar biosynthetic protein FliR [Enterovirga rhinocerotis]|uniref:Flagellar biosynthetic protein FliR n=1 Tax=Enterovirga rhinocerotis TaxID=1339210 RepID=A0A4R7BUZ5_9HYPH|nr:flagellar biosynthetic protein FliR [Enterovirga rhinocerotis]TDR89630.1 flagellar biosynthetic protein FliR [Enterovirga rhinocerotis]